MTGYRIQDALAWAQQQGLARLDAQLLLLHALGRDQTDRAWLLAHDEDALAPDVLARWRSLAGRRCAGEPVAYLTGWQEFYGLRLQVDARVLVPRPDTETLVQWALDVLHQQPNARVLDLGTGSGAVALALKHARPDLDMTARDTSAEALQVAQANAQRHGLSVRWQCEHWLNGLTEDFDLIVSNPPYVAEADLHLADLTFEPTQALTAGPDGLADLRHIIAHAPAHLRRGGWLLLEHGWNQAAAVRGLLVAPIWAEVQTRPDLAGLDRCSGARIQG